MELIFNTYFECGNMEKQQSLRDASDFAMPLPLLAPHVSFDIKF